MGTGYVFFIVFFPLETLASSSDLELLESSIPSSFDLRHGQLELELR
jgi:hypothetical protein